MARNEANCLILSYCDPCRVDDKPKPGKIVFVCFAGDWQSGRTLVRTFLEADGRVRLQKDNAVCEPIVCDRNRRWFAADAAPRSSTSRRSPRHQDRPPLAV